MSRRYRATVITLIVCLVLGCVLAWVLLRRRTPEVPWSADLEPDELAG